MCDSRLTKSENTTCPNESTFWVQSRRTSHNILACANHLAYAVRLVKTYNLDARKHMDDKDGVIVKVRVPAPKGGGSVWL